MRQQAGIPARMRVTDQTGAAADLSQEQYAQTMGAYNAFQRRVKTSIIPTQSHVARLPGGGKAQMRHSFGTNTLLVTIPRREKQSNTIVVDVDFLVIIYESYPGEDTPRTRFNKPFQSNYVGQGEENSIVSKKLQLAVFSLVEEREDGIYVERLVIDIKKVVQIYKYANIAIELIADIDYNPAYIYLKAYKGSEAGEIVADKFYYLHGVPLVIEFDPKTSIISSNY